MDIVEVAFGSSLYDAMKQLRQDVLRTPIGLVLNEKDVAGEDQQIHIAAVENSRVVGGIILKPLSEGTIKFRQIAVASNQQGKGVVREILAFAENMARAKHFRDIEMNARITAQIFYEKLGYKAVGELFKEVGLDTIKMIKTL
jgi:predicted GNAT family N-acyltransferase